MGNLFQVILEFYLFFTSKKKKSREGKLVNNNNNEKNYKSGKKINIDKNIPKKEIDYYDIISWIVKIGAVLLILWSCYRWYRRTGL